MRPYNHANLFKFYRSMWASHLINTFRKSQPQSIISRSVHKMNRQHAPDDNKKCMSGRVA